MLWLIGLVAILFVVSGCTENSSSGSTVNTAVASTSLPNVELASIEAVTLSAKGLGNYEMLEATVDLSAQYENPYDQREVALDAVFIAPDGSEFAVPGFWDGEGAWRIRFTPSEVGDWAYTVTVTDQSGQSEPRTGTFTVSESDRRGWLQIGTTIDPNYSPRYLAWSDGTPWYGRGHADLGMAFGGPDPSGQGFRLLTQMPEFGENFVMWWPTWNNNITAEAYDDYSSAQAGVIDYILAETETAGATVSFTIWTHQYLRTDNHPWGDSRWEQNGFKHLTDIEGFFTDPESLAWQENYYRYTIARWAHSPAIAMWQTITEINGTEAYDQTNPWHERLNAYFQDHDPYRHPTTATMSGSVDWPEGHAVMDMPQMHLYEFAGDPIGAANQVADWTTLMWDREEKPNWIGEYGDRGQQTYPEMMHNANWAALAAGAAMTPAEWNDGHGYGEFDLSMQEDMARFATFVEEVPLVTYDPDALLVSTNDPEVRGWGVAGESGGLFWVQDYFLEGATMDEIHAADTVRSGVVATIDGLTGGAWSVTPYDTWAGVWLDPLTVKCPTDAPCLVALPDFHRDLALELSRT